jgi:prepilin-type N-terminal cleavage/methylation domain-containing protein
MKRRGMTLVELVIGITIIAIAFYVLIAIFVTILPRTARVETLDKKAYLAQEKIEECLARSFANTSNEAGSFTGSFSSYQYQVVVTYVASTELNNPVGGPTDYKNVKVRVWGGPVDPLATVEVVSLVTTYVLAP